MDSDPSDPSRSAGDAAGIDPVARAGELAGLARACAAEAERERRLPERVARAMAAAGLYRVAAPREVGGLECEPATQIETIEVIAAADGAAGWNLMIGVENMGFLGAALEPAVASEVFANPELIVSGALNPLGRAVREDGGYRVTGQWPFASGCHNADWFWGQCRVFDGDSPAKHPDGRLVLREALLPASEFEIVDTWHVSGLRGSGSHDVAARDLFVPESHVTAVTEQPLRSQATLYRLPIFSRLAYNKVGVSTGIARAALDEFVALASEKRPRGAAGTLRDRASAQLALAHSEAELRSARAFVLEIVGEVWDATAAGREVTRRQRALVQLACSGAARASVGAVERVCEVAGTWANDETKPLAKRLRDVRVVPGHIMASPQWDQAVGRVLFGFDDSGALLF